MAGDLNDNDSRWSDLTSRRYSVGRTKRVGVNAFDRRCSLSELRTRGLAAERRQSKRVWKVMGTAAAKMRRTFGEVARGRPGHRFQDFYVRSKRATVKAGAMGRVIRISIAMVTFAIGCALAVIPGPAIPFFFITGALLAMESKVVARLMDWIELRLRAVFEWGKKYWDRLPLVAKMVLVVVMAGLSVAAAVIAYRFFRG
jgi:hypothetical protein